MNKVVFLKFCFNKMPFSEAVEVLVIELLQRKLSRIYYANAHTLVTASQSTALSNALCRSDMLLADGSGVLWGSQLLGEPLIYNLNGTDLVPAICKAGAPKGLSVYFLGAKPGVAEMAAEKLVAACPGLKVVGIQHGYFEASETNFVLARVREAHPHLLLVAMGVPLQEVWIDLHAQHLTGIACMGVGGLFDFMSERIPRAPFWMRQVGVEWIWRLLIEPKRLWGRYVIGNLIFCGLLLKPILAKPKIFFRKLSL